MGSKLDMNWVSSPSWWGAGWAWFAAEGSKGHWGALEWYRKVKGPPKMDKYKQEHHEKRRGIAYEKNSSIFLGPLLFFSSPKWDVAKGSNLRASSVAFRQELREKLDEPEILRGLVGYLWLLQAWLESQHVKWEIHLYNFGKGYIWGFYTSTSRWDYPVKLFGLRELKIIGLDI